MEKPRFTPYQWRLFGFLSVATFFEGYDHIAITQILPNLRAEMQLSESQGGMLVAFINIGTIVAYPLVRQADRWGRRRVLALTIVGYTVFSFLTGLSPNVWAFAAFQFIARVFLIGEWAISMVYAAEEFPAARRGLVIGLISAFAAFGSVACAGVVPILLETELGWRLVYFVGTVPLVLLAFARRSLKETTRFAALSSETRREKRPFSRILRTPHRKRVLQLALIWGLTYLCTQTAVTFWKEFAMAERGFDDRAVGRAITIAAVVAMPLIFLAGKLIDSLGRRWGAALIFTYGALSTAAAYTLTSPLALTIALIGAIFGASAVLPVLNAFNTELFPTEYRSEAMGWANNLLGRMSYVLGPLGVGFAAEQIGWGRAAAATAVGPLIALALILWWMPETRGRELEETAGG